MSDRILKISSGVFSLALLVTLLLKLRNVPGGMILSGLFLGGMMIIGILLGSVVVAFILKPFLKNYSFFTLYFILTAVAFLYFHYTLYSPTLKIIVPKNYTGDVNLVLSSVKENVLTIDSNGIGYIGQWTYDHTYTVPLVFDEEGKNLKDRCVGFNPSTFWGGGKTCCVSGKQIESLSFEIVSKEKIGQKQYNSKDLIALVDKKLVKFVEPDKYTKIDSVSLKN